MERGDGCERGVFAAFVGRGFSRDKENGADEVRLSELIPLYEVVLRIHDS